MYNDYDICVSASACVLLYHGMYSRPDGYVAVLLRDRNPAWGTHLHRKV